MTKYNIYRIECPNPGPDEEEVYYVGIPSNKNKEARQISLDFLMDAPEGMSVKQEPRGFKIRKVGRLEIQARLMDERKEPYYPFRGQMHLPSQHKKQNNRQHQTTHCI